MTTTQNTIAFQRGVDDFEWYGIPLRNPYDRSCDAFTDYVHGWEYAKMLKEEHQKSCFYPLDVDDSKV